MKKYMIALDLDGTLLNNESQLSSNTLSYMKKLKEDGHIIVISTGRPYSGMKMFYDQLELDTPIVNCNGGSVYSPNDKNFKNIYNGIDKNILKDIFIKNDEYIIDAFCDYENRIYRTAYSERLSCLVSIDETTVIKEGKMYDILDIDPSGLIVLVKPECSNKFEDFIDSNYPFISYRIYHKEENSYLYEIYQKNISKATGLKDVLNYYNMTEKDLIGIGDGINDFEMIDFAYTGVAMLNSKEALLKEAKYITKHSNDDDGVIKFLDHFLEKNLL